MGTAHMGNYKQRIIAPIFYNGKMVSYQGRDITEKQIKYKACSTEKEIIHHKHLLYNFDSVSDKMIICEGVADVWRLGKGAVCTFGVAYTKEQVLLILEKKIKKIWILFDNEVEAQKQAEKLAADIILHSGIDVEILIPEDDAGAMTQKYADDFKKRLFEGEYINYD